jgi:hypothetical protein
MAEAEGKLKYQILQKWKIKYHSKKKIFRGSAPNPGRGTLPLANPQPTHRRVGSTKAVF